MSYLLSIVFSCLICPKPRKDKYNKKLKKYYVEIEEDDESIDEDIDILREEEEEVLFSHVIQTDSNQRVSYLPSWNIPPYLKHRAGRSPCEARPLEEEEPS